MRRSRNWPLKFDLLQKIRDQTMCSCVVRGRDEDAYALMRHMRGREENESLADEQRLVQRRFVLLQ